MAFHISSPNAEIARDEFEGLEEYAAQLGGYISIHDKAIVDTHDHATVLATFRQVV